MTEDRIGYGDDIEARLQAAIEKVVRRSGSWLAGCRCELSRRDGPTHDAIGLLIRCSVLASIMGDKRSDPRLLAGGVVAMRAATLLAWSAGATEHTKAAHAVTVRLATELGERFPFDGPLTRSTVDLVIGEGAYQGVSE